MPRFYHPHALPIGSVVPLSDAAAHHVRVLRLAPGEQITLFNGDGGEYAAHLASIDKRQVLAEIKVFLPRQTELPYAVTLAQALPEASKMDWIVEKAVELGATSIQPLTAQRCVVRLTAERASRKMAHWQGIIVSASEQSGRNRLARLSEPMDFSAWVSQRDLHQRILLSPRADQSLSDWARHHPQQALALLIGPEGGFTHEEEESARENGVLALSMGPRILRTETAGLAALAVINGLWGSM